MVKWEIVIYLRIKQLLIMIRIMFFFKTRKNRKLNLTEYYDLVYEYKNDCLTAGIKYKKSF